MPASAQLPDNVDPEHVEAKLENGELTVKVRTPSKTCVPSCLPLTVMLMVSSPYFFWRSSLRSSPALAALHGVPSALNAACSSTTNRGLSVAQVPKVEQPEKAGRVIAVQ